MLQALFITNAADLYVIPFQDFRCPFYPGGHCSMHVSKKYQLVTDLISPQKYLSPTLSNPNIILDQFTYTNCYVTVTDYGKNVHFANVSIPILLRKLHLAWHYTVRSISTSLSPIFIQQEFLSRKRNATEKLLEINVPTSLYWGNLWPYLHLNIFTYSMKIKSWNCDVFVDLALDMLSLL